jgi:REP element-mobilizing transposase RayT
MVEDAIREHCDIRNWSLHAVNARTNHVHVVVTATGTRPESVRDQFKAWCTRRLKADVPTRARFWTEGGSCRWINQEADLEAAVLYVVEAQDRKKGVFGEEE